MDKKDKGDTGMQGVHGKLGNQGYRGIMGHGYMGNRETGYTEIQRYMETGKQDTGNT